MKKIFIAVNYNTSDLIENWYNSIQRTCVDNTLYIVDNFYSKLERYRVVTICESLGICLLESENVGYGRAMNKCLSVVKSKHEDCIIVAGNLDVTYLHFPEDLQDGNYVYVCEAMEGSRNRNPFLTKFQSRFLPLYTLPLSFDNVFVLRAVSLCIRVTGIFPSKLWAVHGSVFCFSSRLLSDIKIFNEETFLYSEELEFASYVEHISKSEFKMTAIRYQHTAHAATSSIIKKRGDFFAVWKPGFSNWRKRWSVWSPSD
jgi:glycosyltransferase involved in cell wall biosynthesis